MIILSSGVVSCRLAPGLLVDLVWKGGRVGDAADCVAAVRFVGTGFVGTDGAMADGWLTGVAGTGIAEWAECVCGVGKG